MEIRMKIHTIKGYINNLFIAEYDHGLLLLDGASPADLSVIEEFCNNTLKRPASDIKLAVVTHMHPDHSGAAPLLRKKYGTRIAACRNIDNWYKGPSGWFQHILDCMMAQIVAVKMGTKIHKVFSRWKLKPDFPVEGGDILPGFPEWKVVHTPGHTTHDIALFHSRKRILYCGDSIIEVRGRYYLPLPVIFKNKMRHSYKEMASLGASTILIPHGNIIHTDDSREIFKEMISLLEEPPNRLRRRIYYFSVWSPMIWKPTVRKLLFG
jgi:glyoxylase-like metal-dependent hydrolase (beta-lactamase superfamily II)